VTSAVLRDIRTARGGRWHVSSVANLLARANHCAAGDRTHFISGSFQKELQLVGSGLLSRHFRATQKAIMSKTINKEDITILVADASEMFDETGCVPGLDGEEVPAERLVPHAKQYISETIDDSKALCDPKILDTPGFMLVISWLSQKWLHKCQKLAPRGTKNPDQHLSKEQQNECLVSAAAELIREITQRKMLN